MAEPTFAGRLLELAERDVLTYRKSVDDPEVHETVALVHAQQAVEKALKAVLAHAEIAHRRTHDIAELLDALDDADIAPPPHAERLDELNPHAVQYRYGLVDPAGLDQVEVNRMLDDLLHWAGLCLTRRKQSAEPETQGRAD